MRVHFLIFLKLMLLTWLQNRLERPKKSIVILTRTGKLTNQTKITHRFFKINDKQSKFINKTAEILAITTNNTKSH